MTDVSAFDQALARSRRGQPATPQTRRSLADIACLKDLPGRDGLGPPLEEEYPDGFVLDERFVLREAIGRSGAATIYRAEDRVGGGVVAVKVPLLRMESDPVSFGRFQREARIGASLSDPLLLRFIRPDLPRSRPYIVTEFLDGCTLAMVIHRTNPIPQADALRIASVLCQAVGHLHRRNLIHRDLKPANIMICRDQRLCLMDFGLAAEIDIRRGILAGLTPLFGTPEYMAPEQVRNTRNDVRTDIYSIGVILFQMLTGVLPYQSEDPWAAAQMRVTGDPAAPRSLNPEITPQAEEIVLRALRRRPDERYPTVADLQADLDTPERVHVTGLSGRLRAPRWRLSLQGTPFLAGGMIGVGFLLFLVGVFLVLMRHR